MAIKIKYEDLNSETFNQGLNRIDGHTGFPVKTTYRISRISGAVAKERKRVEELYKKLLKEHCELDEKGAVIHEGPFKNVPKFKDGQKEAYDEKFKELMAMEFVVKVHPVKLSELEKVNLTPGEMAACECLLDLGDAPDPEAAPAPVEEKK